MEVTANGTELSQNTPLQVCQREVEALRTALAVAREQATVTEVRSQELERHNAELQQTLDRLSESEQRYRTLFELSSEGIMRWEFEQPIPLSLPVEEQVELCYRSMYIAEANAAYAAMFGYENAEAAIGWKLPDVHIADSETNRTMMQAYVENGHCTRNAETEEVDRTRRMRYFLNNAVSTIKDDCVVGTWSTQADITELRETQQALLKAEQARVAELAKANEALARASERLANQPDLSAFLNHITLEAIAQLGADAAMLSVLDEQHQILRAVAHVEQGHIPVSTLAVEMSVNEAAFVGVLLEARKPRYFDLEKEAHLFWPGAIDYHRQRRHQAVMAVPLFAGGNFLGHLGLAFTHNDPIKEQGSELLYALAQQAALAIQLTRLAEEAKQAAIVREQERAAQERAAELAKANEALKRGVERLVASGTIDAVLDSFLLEVIAVTNAAAGAVMRRGRGHEFSMKSLAENGDIIYPFDPHAPEALYRQRTANDTSGIMRRTAAGEVLVFSVDGVEAWFPEAAAYHNERGHRTIWHFPFQVGGEVAGYLGLAFCEECSPSAIVQETVQTLALQVSLALEAQRLAEEAKQAAIAREQEQATQERAAELAKANEALGRSLNRLANERNLNSFLEHILQEALKMLDGAIAQIFIYDPEADTLMPSVGVDVQGAALPAPGLMNNLPISEPFPATITKAWERLLNQRSPIYFDRVRDAADYWPGTINWHQSMGHCGAICTALMMGNQPLGVLGLALRGRTEFTASEFEFFQALGQQATLAIQLTRLAEEAKQAAILEERNRMAREIHDTLAQAFTSISLHLGVAKRIVAHDPTEACELIDQANELAHAGLAEARRSVWALHPDAERYQDLAGELSRSLQQMMVDAAIAFDFQIQGTPHPLPPDVGLNLLRIGQEALTNTLRHAAATHVTLHLRYEPTSITLEVQDNGCGFDLSYSTQSGGFGLLGMQQRCDRLNGQFTVISQPGAGTQILAQVPLVEP